MRIVGLIQEDPGSSIAISRRDETSAEERRQAHEAAYDVVSISDEARKRLEAQKGGEARDKEKNPHESEWTKQAYGALEEKVEKRIVG